MTTVYFNVEYAEVSKPIAINGWIVYTYPVNFIDFPFIKGVFTASGVNPLVTSLTK